MFWSKKTIESAEFQRLFKMIEETRLKVEMMNIELQLYKNKLSKKAGIKTKEDEEVESETNKNPQILLNPNGNPVGNSKRS